MSQRSIRCAVVVSARGFAALCAMTCAVLICSSTQAALIPTIIYEQNFNAGLPATGFTQIGNTSVTGVSGAAQLTNSGNLSYITDDVFTGETFTVDADINHVNGSPGGSVSGLIVGNRAYTFFPGFTGGAFNVYAYNPVLGSISLIQGDTNMGFTPAQNVFHHFQVDVDPILNNIDVRIYENGNLTSTPFLYQAVGDSSFVAGKIGFFSFSGSHDSLNDNLTVTALREEPAPIPEPGSAVLLGLGLLGICATRRRATRRETRGFDCLTLPREIAIEINQASI